MRKAARRQEVTCILTAFILTLLVPPSWAAPPGAWTAKSNLQQARTNHTATLLANGKILVVGGEDAAGHGLPTAELYDPATGAYTLLSANLPVPVSGHTATLLKNGNVLIVGGKAESGAPIPYAQVFDAGTANFSGPLGLYVARNEHTATLLNDDRVLIAGGSDGTSALADLEVYDPLANAFTRLYSGLVNPRQRHTATLLDDGKVIFIGGNDASGSLASAELYDPSNNTVTTTAGITAARTKASAALLLDGTILIVGGQNSAGQDLDTAEIYDPTAHTSTPLPVVLSAPRSGHVGLGLQDNGRVIIAGGTTAGNLATSVEVYNPITQTFSTVGSLLTARKAFGTNFFAPPYTGGLLATGGVDVNNVVLRSSELFSYPTLRTDKQDYPPGYTVKMMGEGWQPNETIDILIHENNTDPDITMTVSADANGAFSFDAFTTDSGDIGMSFLATASGPVSNWTAQTKFSDSVISVTITAPTTGTQATRLTTALPSPVTVAFSYVTSSTGATTGVATLKLGGTTYTNSKALAPGTGSDSIAVTIPNAAPVGSYDVQVQVTNSTGGGSNNKSDTQPNAVIVSKANTTTTITSDSPDPSDVGQPVTVNYTVVVVAPGIGTPTGNVTVDDGAGTTCTGTVAAGTCSMTFTTAGPKTLTATYAGDAAFNGSPTASGTAHQVNAATTTTSITSDSPDPSVVGQTVAVNFTVAPSASGTPTGNVTVSDGTVNCTGTVAAGNCSLTFTSVGSKSLTATYAGNANFSGSTSAPASHLVNQANTTATITSDTPDPSVTGQGVVVNYTVVVQAPGGGTLTGNVTVSDGAANCTGTVAAGTCTITFTTTGTKSLTASYVGDTNFNSSASTPASHIVNKADTLATASSSPNPSTFGQSVTLSATVVAVAPGSGIPTGTVSFEMGATIFGTGTLNGAGQASTTVSSLPAGNNGGIKAKYLGDLNFNPNTSSPITQVVNKASTSTVVVSSLNPSNTVQAVTFTATVSSGAGTPTGTVSFYDGGTCLAPGTTLAIAVAMTGGAASTTTAPLSAGPHTILACYNGDSNFATSSGTVIQTVNPANTAPTVATPNATVTVGEGTTATNNGTYSDPDSGDTVTITASIGIISKTGANSGTWTWSFPTNDGPSQSQPVVTITADDGKGGVTTTFSLTVTNVAPTATLGNNGPVNEGSPATISFSAQSDPSTADTAAGFHYAFSCTNVSLAAATYATSGTSANINCTFDDNGTKTVKARIIDKDNDFTEYTTAVTVNNVAPTATLGNNGPVNEGSAATISFSAQSDPSTADTAAGFHYAYSCTNGSLAGSTYLSSGTTTSSPCAFIDNGTPTVRARIIDKDDGFTEYTTVVTVNNVAPASVTVVPTSVLINENDSITVTGSFTDPGILDTHTVIIDWGDGSLPTTLNLAANVLIFGATHQYLDDNPTGTASDLNAISVTVTDKDGGVGSGAASVTVNNLVPVITTVTGPLGPLPVSSATATIMTNFTDVGSQDTHTCTFSWDDSTPNTTTAGSTGSGSCSQTHTYTAAGVYTVGVTVTDDDTGSATSKFEFVVVYDPSGGFVTGGGWINSPAGAYAADLSLTGKATFGFVSKYQKGATIPVGETEFQFHVASFNFHSTVYEWLVVSGPKAQYKGSGTVNGTGDYGFLLTATDGQVNGGGGVDKFRIKIWDKTTSATVYDNVPAASDDIDAANPQALGGGSIVVHK